MKCTKLILTTAIKNNINNDKTINYKSAKEISITVWDNNLNKEFRNKKLN